MLSFSRKSGSAALIALGMTTSTVAPLVIPAPASAQASFSDVRSHWAGEFITRLAAENVIAGFPDGTFKPDQPVTRAQFAAIIRQAFNENQIRQIRGFADVPANYWAAPAIQEAYETGFMAGYPGSRFLPNQEIPKVQVLVSLASGLRYSPKSTNLSVYSDAGQIPDYAINGVAAATEKGIVVNYPNLKFLNPNETATRGDVAAYIYQALVSEGEFQPLASRVEGAQYIVNRTAAANTNTAQTSTTTPSSPQKSGVRVLRNQQIKVKFPGAGVNSIILVPGQTVATTLEVAADVKNANGGVTIPVASQIEGQLVPVTVRGSNTPATQFRANKVTIRGQTYPINATSDPIVATSNVSASTVKGGRTTDAAQDVLGRILGGNTALGSILSGVLTGGVSSPNTNTNQNQVIVVNQEDLLLTLQSDLEY